MLADPLVPLQKDFVQLALVGNKQTVRDYTMLSCSLPVTLLRVIRRHRVCLWAHGSIILGNISLPTLRLQALHRHPPFKVESTLINFALRFTRKIKSCFTFLLPWWANGLLVENLHVGRVQYPESTCKSGMNSDLGEWVVWRSVQAGGKVHINLYAEQRLKFRLHRLPSASNYVYYCWNACKRSKRPQSASVNSPESNPVTVPYRSAMASACVHGSSVRLFVGHAALVSSPPMYAPLSPPPQSTMWEVGDPFFNFLQMM